jgi:pyruvate dehydrogenase E2 component (dihydrolipoamide acetyltransferase)
MAIPITIPRLGWSMEEGVFAGWLKRDGEEVRAGEPLFSLEGDKATQEIEALDSGILKVPPTAPAAGTTVTVGAVIGFLLQRGEIELPGSSESPAFPPKTTEREQAAVRPASAAVRSDRPRSSPLARRLAREHGVEWTKLTGSGSSGRIRRVDVLAAVQARAGQTQAHTPPPRQAAAGAPAPAGGRAMPASRARRAIAAKMMDSRRTTAPVTLTSTADATNLVALRRQFKSAEPQARDLPGITDFLVKLTAITLRDHPLLNARWSEGDDQIVLYDEANIGIAVDTDAGLVVPVIKGAAALGVRQIAAISRELVARAQERRLRSEEIEGGTFTITNLGSLGIDTFTPIINPPQCAILGVGKIERRPVMDGDKVVGGDQMSLCLTFDHRIVDGAPAARFLQQLSRAIENPAPWMMP